MVKIISFFIKLLNIFNKLSFKMECFLLRFLPKEPDTLVNSEAYCKFKVDPLPITKEEHLPISLADAISIYKEKHHGKEPKPINRRKPLDIPSSATCPHCGASADFIYDNKSGKLSKQYRCKICDTAFRLDTSYSSQIAHYCPFCGCKLDLRKRRSHYLVYRCPNTKCSFYLHNLKSLSKVRKPNINRILLPSSYAISLVSLMLLYNS